MSATHLAAALAAAAATAIGCGEPTAAPASPLPKSAVLGGGDVAHVGEVRISSELVARVASIQLISPKDALERLVEDALLAEGARADGFDRAPRVALELEASAARLTLVRLREEARAAGPPTDAEVNELSSAHWLEVDTPPQMRVIHAVILRPAKTDAGLLKRALAASQELAATEQAATSAGDFESRAKGISHGGLDLRVERLQPFVADGRIAVPGEGSYEAAFAAAAAGLPAAGATTGVVETRFGWHVIRLLERLPAREVPFEERRALFADECRTKRAGAAEGAITERLRRAVRIDVANGVDSLMTQGVAAVTHAEQEGVTSSSDPR
jgi:peptidyl-prolyl cis-trans isomerase C